MVRSGGRSGGVALSSPIEELADHYEVVVVGSGYGAGVAACRLARMGREVCVLERGRERWPGEYPDSLLSALPEVQLNGTARRFGDRRAMFEFHENDDLHALVGCGLGGTSLINANVCEPAEPRVFTDDVWPPELRVADGVRPLQAYEDRARTMLRPTPYPSSAVLRKTTALGTSAGYLSRSADFRRPAINVTFETTAGPAGLVQQPCTGCGDCVTGCNHWAKNTTLMNYLPDAAAHGARFFTEIEVDRIERRPAGGWTVVVRATGAGRHRFGREGEMALGADVVILGAGTLGSTGILLRSADAGLELSPALGTRLSGNGDVLAFGYNADVTIDGFAGHRGPPPDVGPCITAIIDERGARDLDDGMVIEEGSIPSPIAWPTMFMLAGVVRFGGDPRLATLRRIGRQLLGFVRGPAHGATARTQTYLVMGHDGSDGRIELDSRGEVRMRWPGVGEKPVFDRIDAELRDASAALGANHLRNPLWSKLFGEDLITVHPLGGCPMGADVTSGVVDHAGRVFDPSSDGGYHDGLYVLDGSIVPRSVGINPLLTIAALAERGVEHLAGDLGWDDEAGGLSPATRTWPDRAGVMFTERMAGRFTAADGDESPMSFVVTIVTPPVDEFLADDEHRARMVGTCRCPALATRPMTVSGGVFNLFRAAADAIDTVTMDYRFDLMVPGGAPYRFRGTKVIAVGPVTRMWPETTTLSCRVEREGVEVGRATLRVGVADFLRQLTTMRAVGGGSVRDRVRALGRFGRFFDRTLLDHYGGVAGRITYPGQSVPPTRPLPTGRSPRLAPPLRPSVEPAVRDLVTGDGATIRLSRYQGGDRGPVMLVHGAAVSSAIFSTDLVADNLTNYLCRHGYDVWLLDTRFSTALPGCRQPSTGDQIARFDHPAAVAEIRRETGAQTIQAVVHCYGSNTFFMALLSGLEGVRSVVASQVAAHLDPPGLTDLKTWARIPRAMQALRFPALDSAASAAPTWRERVIDRALRLSPVDSGEGCMSATCRRATFLFGHLWEHANLSPRVHDNLHTLVGPASVSVFVHLAAMVRAGHLVDARGGNTYLPNVDRLDIPIRFVHGERNRCYLPRSTALTQQWLIGAGHGGTVDRVVVPGHGHLDCLFGEAAPDMVFPHVLEHLEAT